MKTIFLPVAAVLAFLITPLIASSTASAEQIDVFFVGGQSNANPGLRKGVEAGLAETENYTDAVVVHLWHNGRPMWRWMKLKDGQPTPQDLYSVDFYNERGTGLLQAMFAGMREQGHTPVFRGLFWMQGETDAYGPDNAEKWRPRFEAMLAQIQTDMKLEQPFPFVIAVVDAHEEKLEKHHPGMFARYTVIRAEQMATADAAEHGAYVDTRPWPRENNERDSVHINDKQRMEIGKAMVQEMVGLLEAP